VSDRLTGLKNRRALHSAFEQLNQSRFSVAIFDIDGFKSVNDRFGHAAGDDLLVAMAKHLKAAF
jgi:diguanylate cyclase (GGDEF)-like protein